MSKSYSKEFMQWLGTLNQILRDRGDYECVPNSPDIQEVYASGMLPEDAAAFLAQEIS